MKSAWSKTEGGFSFAAGSLTGVLERSAEPSALSIVLDKLRIGSLGNLSWRLESDGSAGAVHPMPDVAYLQQPYVVAPFVLETPSEFRLTGFFRATDDGVDVDFRLATVRPVTNVSLELQAEWPASGYQPLPELTRNRPYPCPGVAVGVVDFGRGKAVLLTDVGEHGVFTPTSDGATLQLFNQSLEKGVILVGRFALRPSTYLAHIKKDLDDWLDHPSASL
jgi:hypothetical protein